jgi:hypothetical protein
LEGSARARARARYRVETVGVGLTSVHEGCEGGARRSSPSSPVALSGHEAVAGSRKWRDGLILAL